VNFGKQDVSVAAGWLQGRVTAKIDSDLGIGGLIDLARKLVTDSGIPPWMAGGAANRLLEKSAPIFIGDSATVWRVSISERRGRCSCASVRWS